MNNFFFQYLRCQGTWGIDKITDYDGVDDVQGQFFVFEAFEGDEVVFYYD